MNHFYLASFAAIPFALLLDHLLGEPKRFHPLIGFGKMSQAIETYLSSLAIRLNKPLYTFILGIFAWSLAVIPIVLLIYFIPRLLSPFSFFLFSIVIAWLAIGWNSLQAHGLAVANAFEDADIEQARLKTSYLVSRDTSELDETSLSRATIESLLENGNDAIFAALFWLGLLGAPGIVLYRLSNTLDAMWGYRNERFEYFGKFTARVDDVLNYIPARICALLYALCASSNNHRKSAFTAWKTQAHNWYSPNAGVVMATGAGALGLRLGGSAIYHNKLKERPNLGNGDEAQASDIIRAIKLLNHSVYLLAISLITFFIIGIGVK